MSQESTHIIKRDDVATSRIVQPDPTVLQSSFRIPNEHIETTDDGVVPQPIARRRRRVREEDALLARDSFEVKTHERETARRSRPENTAEKEGLSNESPQAKWEERLEQAVATAREEGFEAGKASLQAEMEQAMLDARTAFADDLTAVQQSWEGHLKDSRVRLVQLAFRIAEVVLDAPLPPDLRRITETTVTDAIERMIDDIPVEVALHPVNYLRIQESGLEAQLSAVHSKLRWRSDANLKENEWIIQSNRSATRRLEAELLDDLQRELALRDLPFSSAHEDDRTDDPNAGMQPDEPAGR